MGIELHATGDTELTEPQQQILQTLLRAFNLMLERERVYGSAWTRYGVSDKVMHVRDITNRVEHLVTVVSDPDSEPAHKLEDLLLDLVNYSAMGAFQTQQGRFS